MKNNILQHLISHIQLIVVLTLSFVWHSCQKEKPIEEITPKKPMIEMNDSIFSVDSLELSYYMDKLFKYYENDKYDSILWLGKHYSALADRCCAYRSDSMVCNMAWFATGAIAQGLVLTGKIEEGLPLMLKWQEKYIQKYGYDAHVTEQNVGIGQAYGLLGDFQKEIEYNLKSLALFPSVFNNKNHYYYGNVYQNIANTYLSMGDPDMAMSYYWKAYQNYAEVVPQSAPYSLFQIGKILLDQNNLVQVDTIIQQLKIVRDTSSDPQDQIIYFTLAGLYKTKEGDFNEARKLLTRLLRLQENLPVHLRYLPENRAEEGLRLLGEMELRAGETHRAITFFNDELKLFRFYHGSNNPKEITIARRLAKAYATNYNYLKAISLLQNSIHMLDPTVSETNFKENPTAEQTTPMETLLQLLIDKAVFAHNWHTKQGDYTEKDIAMKTFDVAFSLMDRLLMEHEYEASQLTLANWTRSAFEDAFSLYYNQYQQSRNPIWLDKILTIMEKSKYTSLQQALRKQQAFLSCGVPVQTLEKEQKIKTLITYYEKERFKALKGSEKARTENLTYFEDKLGQLRKSKDSLEADLKNRFPDYYRLKKKIPTLTASEIKTWAANSKIGFIEYFKSDTIIYTVFISADTQCIQSQRIDSSLMADINSFPRLVQYGSFSFNDFIAFVKNARTLYNQLLAPVLATDTSVKKLVILPDGSLGKLPFHLLLETETSPQILASYDWRKLPYLLKTKYIRYEYSAAMLLEKQPSRTGEQFYIGFAPAFSGQSLAARGLDSMVLSRAYPNWRNGTIPDLKSNRPEVDQASKIANGKAFLASAATESAFKQNAPGCAVIHLATHACTDDSDPMYSQILFTPTPGNSSEDGSLHAFELYNMRLNANLVVLSACQTGAGKVQRGEGVMSLARAFKYAGCPNIVMSLWNADDATSKDIMIAFFRNLKAGMEKDLALCIAQRDFLDHNTLELSHPALWANFVLVGDDKPVSFHSRKWDIAFLTLALSAAILYLFFWRHDV